MPNGDGRESARGLRVLAGVLLLAVYALPLFAPPAAGASPPSPGAGLLAQFFPQLPWWWVVGRLGALAVGAALVASAVPRPVAGPVVPDSRGERPWVRPWAPYAALIASALHVLSLWWIADMAPWAQTLFMLWLAVPTLLIWLGLAARPRADRGGAPASVWPVVLLIMVVTSWIATRWLVSYHAPRAADMVDMWRAFGGMVRMVKEGGNFLTGGLGVAAEGGEVDVVGENAIQFFFNGLPLLQWTSMLPTLRLMQLLSLGWLSVAAIALAAVAARLVGRAAMPVAAAAFLFSPFVMVWQIGPIPSIAIVIPAVMAWLLVEYHRSGSPVLLAALGAVAGLAATLPPTIPMTGIVLLLVLGRLWRDPRRPLLAAASAGLSFLAVFGTNFPTPARIAAMAQQHWIRQLPWAEAERFVLGQGFGTMKDWTLVDPPGTIEIAASALLSPFVIPRDSLRLLGDTLLDPCGAALVAVGIALCLRHLWRDWWSALLLVVLFAALLPGFFSSYDRPSLFRLNAAMIPLALLAAVGFEGLRQAVAGRVLPAVLVVLVPVAMAAGGTAVFDRVNPRLLGASVIGLLARAVAEEDLARAALLSDDQLRAGDRIHSEIPLAPDVLRQFHPYLDEILRTVPRRPVPVIQMRQLDPTGDAGRILFWGPALEKFGHIRERVCRLWPAATLYRITDRAGRSRAYAVNPSADGWRPAVGREQWRATRCDATAPAAPELSRLGWWNANVVGFGPYARS